MKKSIVSLFALMLLAVNAIAQCDVPGTVTATVRLVRKPSNLLHGQFSVASGVKVSFAQGNLQYQASTTNWQFAANQYDIIGSGNNSISSSNTGWIDLFGYGTSGESSKYPYMTSTTDGDYYGSNIAESDYDWGQKNYTVDVEAGYRVLTADEWTYLMSTRTNASNLRGLAVVNEVKGLLLMPDNWINPGVTFNHLDNAWTDTYDADDWSLLEASGAVFFPAAGYRSGTSSTIDGNSGYYWTGTAGKCLYFTSGGITMNYTAMGASKGLSVRLVQTL